MIDPFDISSYNLGSVPNDQGKTSSRSRHIKNVKIIMWACMLVCGHMFKYECVRDWILVSVCYSKNKYTA